MSDREEVGCSECGCVNAEHHLMEVLRNTEAALRESQARVEEYRREVERRDELLAGADADLRESQAREAALVEACRKAVEREYYDGQMNGLRAALASPSDAAAKLLERVATLERSEEIAVNRAGIALADRDRWLGHVRVALPLLYRFAPLAIRDSPAWDAVRVAQRDLEQHDAGRGK